MLEAGAGLRFAQEARLQRLVEISGQHLDRGRAPESEIAGEKDLSHPAGPQSPVDAVMRDRGSYQVAFPAQFSARPPLLY
jgi:hypothetical protein